MFAVSAKYEQLKEHLQNLVKSGELRPDDKILSERDMARQYNLSIATVNKAVSDLVADGVFYRKPKKGTFVNMATLPHSMKNIYFFAYGASAEERYPNSMAQIASPQYLHPDYSFITRMIPRLSGNPEFFISEIHRITNVLKVDAILTLAATMTEEFLDKCSDIKIPLIFLGDFKDERYEKYRFDQITGNNALLCRDGVKILAEAGHKHIACAIGDTAFSFNREGWEAIKEFAEANNVEAKLYEITGNASHNEQVENGFIQNINKHDALFWAGAGEDALMKLMIAAEVKIPEQISTLSIFENLFGISWLKRDMKVFYEQVYAKIEKLLAKGGACGQGKIVVDLPVTLKNSGTVIRRK